MTLQIPQSLATRPLRLWTLVGLVILRRRHLYFLILPVCLGLALFWRGWSTPEVIAASLLAYVLGWVLFTTHEFGHVAMTLVESYGFSDVELQISRGGVRSIGQTLVWMGWRLLNALEARGLPVRKIEREIQVPQAGYLRVKSDMVLSSHAKMRIALAGVALPLALAAILAALGVALLALVDFAGAPVVIAVLVAGLVYSFSQPFFSGLIFNGKAYSDLGYAANYLLFGYDFEKINILKMLVLLTFGMARQVPAILADLAAYFISPQRHVLASKIADMRPKRTCLSWIYKRDEEGRFTDRVVLLAPLGMALLKRLTASPRGAELERARRLLSNPALLRQQVSFNRVFSLELNELASRAWEQADGELTVRGIAERLAAELEQPLEVILPALESFFSDLHRKYMINLNWPEEPVREYPRLTDVVFDYGTINTMIRHILAKPEAARAHS